MSPAAPAAGRKGPGKFHRPSQKWTAIPYGGGTVYQNVKTGLYLAPTSTGQYAPVTVNAGMNGQPTQPDAWALAVHPNR